MNLQEYYRAKAAAAMPGTFEAVCADHGVRVKSSVKSAWKSGIIRNAYEKWYLCLLLVDGDGCYSDGYDAVGQTQREAPYKDPLFPCSGGVSALAAAAMDAVIAKEFAGVSIGADKVASLCAAMRSRVTAEARRLAKLQVAPGGSFGSVAVRAFADEAGRRMHELKLVHPWVKGSSSGGGDERGHVVAGNNVAAGTVCITDKHRRKLQALFAQGSVSSGSDDGGFDGALFRCLMRYQALGGASFQAALPRPVFEALGRAYGVDFELFASPFNAHFGRGQYCSAFADTDGPFGSRGSFFAFAGSADAPVNGSFELNPPFVGAHYRRVLEVCGAWFARAEAAGGALCVVVVVGAGAREAADGDGDDDDDSDDGDDSDDSGDNGSRVSGGGSVAWGRGVLRSLASSCWCRQSLRLAHGTHAYVSGKQHVAPGERPFAACDSALFVWQTTAACVKFPVSSEKAEDIRAAFVPPPPRRREAQASSAAGTKRPPEGCRGEGHGGGVAGGSKSAKKEVPKWLGRASDNRAARKAEAKDAKARLGAMRKQRKEERAAAGKAKREGSSSF